MKIKKPKLSIRNIKLSFKSFFKSLALMALILIYWLDSLLKKLENKLRFISKLRIILHKGIVLLDPVTNPITISRLDLINLAIKNMKQKKARTLVTVGGMMIGIASIVFLLSIGYGLQDLVINRVARLEEMKQTDVSIPPGSNLTITEENLKEFARINNVESIAPIIALVAKASYNNSSTDLVAFGVTRDYLEQSAIKPVQGEMFIHNDISLTQKETSKVSGEVPVNSDEVTISIDQGEWVAIRDQADPNGTLLGYTKDLGTEIKATKIVGREYVIDAQVVDRWYEVNVPIWNKDDNGEYVKLNNDDGSQVTSVGFIAEVLVTVSGDYSAAAQTGGSAIVTKQIDISKDVSNQVVVNRSALDVLGLTEETAIGTKFDLSFVVTGELLNEKNQQLQSTLISYEIIGVTPDDRSPVIYVPLIDLRTMGIDNFSQVKVTVDSDSKLSKVRDSIENYGYNTSSVSDTVSQINSLFASARVMLGMLGLIALLVASLGMFNTLTISLLERTHEVGLMKAMGMRSSEVKDLFLAESMILGSSGGFLGLLAGYLFAKFIELLVSGYAIFKGVGFVSIVSIPILFAFVIILLSFIVGWLTGIYPAKRSTKISALNALRYE